MNYLSINPALNLHTSNKHIGFKGKLKPCTSLWSDDVKYKRMLGININEMFVEALPNFKKAFQTIKDLVAKNASKDKIQQALIKLENQEKIAKSQRKLNLSLVHKNIIKKEYLKEFKEILENAPNSEYVIKNLTEFLSKNKKIIQQPKLSPIELEYESLKNLIRNHANKSQIKTAIKHLEESASNVGSLVSKPKPLFNNSDAEIKQILGININNTNINDLTEFKNQFDLIKKLVNKKASISKIQAETKKLEMIEAKYNSKNDSSVISKVQQEYINVKNMIYNSEDISKIQNAIQNLEASSKIN